MPEFEEASPICRGKNVTWETVLLFYNNMPRESMPKSQFNSYTEARLKGWTQTHSQIARQLALYYEEDGICYPRFTKNISYSALLLYMQNWASKYFTQNDWQLTGSYHVATPAVTEVPVLVIDKLEVREGEFFL